MGQEVAWKMSVAMAVFAAIYAIGWLITWTWLFGWHSNRSWIAAASYAPLALLWPLFVILWLQPEE